jgi:hypothetical protein
MKTAFRLFAVIGMAAALLGPAAAFAQNDNDDPSDAEYRKLLERLRKEEKARREYRKQLAEHYYSVAMKRFDERRYTEAEKNLEAALSVDPAYRDAKQLLGKVREIMGKTKAGETDIIDRHIDERRVGTAVAVRETRSTIAEARELIDEGNYDDALKKLAGARDSARILSREIDMSADLAQIKSLSEKARKLSKQAKKEEEQKEREQAQKLAIAEKARLEDLRQQRINRLFEDANQLYDETRYLLAARKAEEILKIDPRNAKAEALRDKAYQQQVKEDLEWYDRTQKNETAATWRKVRKLAIPFTQVQPIYPDDWDEKRRRTAGIQIEAEAGEAEEWRKALEKKLEEPVSFDFIATPLDDVVAFLQQLKDVNIVVDKKAIAELGPNAGLDVTLRLSDVKFKDALEWILRLVNLKYTLQDGVIYISTKEKIGQTKQTVTKFYEVTDLTVEIRNFKPNVRAISNADLEDDDFEDIFAEDGEDEDLEADTFTGQSLVEFIKSVIEPRSWEELPGGGGGLAPL